MKKILPLIFCFLPFLNLAQVESKDYLIEKLKTHLNNNQFEEAHLDLVALKGNYKTDDQIRFLTAASAYYTAINRGQIKYKDYGTLRSLTVYFDKELEYFENKEKYEQLLFMDTVLDFAFLYYYPLKKNLNEEEISQIENDVLNQAIFLKGKLPMFEEKLTEIIDFIEHQ